MRRQIEAELLDDLPSTDSRAVRSRADLRLLNRIMGHARILTNVLRRQLGRRPVQTKPFEWIELGGGDGTLLLDLARRWSVLGRDRPGHAGRPAGHRRRKYPPQLPGARLAARMRDGRRFHLGRAGDDDLRDPNLFLHHFPEGSLAHLLRCVAKRTNLLLPANPDATSPT